MWECGLKHDELAQTNSQTPSLLMWECGLKQPWDIILEYHLNVTPYVGVWIETSISANDGNSLLSLLMWECGLKPDRIDFLAGSTASLLMWECGLKQLYIPYFYLFQRHSLCGSVD